MNSVFQILLSGTVPELANRYGCWTAMNNANTNNANVHITQHEFLRAVAPTIAPTDVLCQTTKLACALTSGVFAKPTDDSSEDSAKNSSIDPKYRLAPRMMKHCIGKDHVDFRTAQQQDAAQFLQYFLERLDRAELCASANLKAKMGDPVHTSSHLFSFRTISRLVCSADGKIKYKDNAPENIMHLRIPMDKAEVPPDEPIAIGSPEHKKLKAEDESETGYPKKAIPTIDLQTCLNEWAAETIVPDIRWPHRNNTISAATQTARFGSFPRYLIVQLQRYELGSDWQPIKLEVNVKFPEQIDLTQYKSTGPKEGESLVPDDDEEANKASSLPNATTIDEAALSQLMDMGFTFNSCKRALTAVGGSDVEAAMGWVFEHNMDPDFYDPLPEEITGGRSTDYKNGVDESVVATLVASLGAFTADQIRVALKETNGAADRAADWLFSHVDDLDGAIAAASQKSQDTSRGESRAKVPPDDGEGQYSLIGMISHIGKSTGSGHYVAHVKRNGKWIIFNDEKVALSSKPPFEHAYLYLLQRNDAVGSLHANY
jgi:ubiquitin carboxyl-terminal hydrolase 5/13